MSDNIIWTNQATEQFIEQKRHILKFSTDAAITFEQNIIHKTNLLKQFPHLGKKLHLLRNQFRELIVMNYRIIYQVTSKEIYIISLFHTAQIPRN